MQDIPNPMVENQFRVEGARFLVRRLIFCLFLRFWPRPISCMKLILRPVFLKLDTQVINSDICHKSVGFIDFEIRKINLNVMGSSMSISAWSPFPAASFSNSALFSPLPAGPASKRQKCFKIFLPNPEPDSYVPTHASRCSPGLPLNSLHIDSFVISFFGVDDCSSQY